MGLLSNNQNRFPALGKDQGARAAMNNVDNLFLSNGAAYCVSYKLMTANLNRLAGYNL